MHESIYRLKKELVDLLRKDRLLKEAIKEVNKLDMIKASLIVRNANHEKIDIDGILKGELQKDVPVKDYVFIENFCNVIRVAQNCIEMGNYLDRHLLLSAYRILSENDEGYFRKTNPVVYAFNHVPAHSLDIEEKLDDMVRRVYSPEAGDNVILKAMYIHNKLIDIYPFEEFSGEIAVFSMNYFFMENGLTPINMPLRKDEYYSMVSDCLKGRNQEQFYNFLTRAMYEKMKGTVEACREYMKNKQGR